MFSFGAGRARLIPASGGQPVELGVVQNATVELRVDLKDLRGPYRYPITVADGKGTASGKVNFMHFWPPTLAAIMGGTITANAQQVAIAEPQTVPAMTTFTVTPTNAAVMVAGSEIVSVVVNNSPVYYARTTAGTEAAATTANPTGGKYSISGAGVLTFAAADASRQVYLTYNYTPAANNPNVGVSLQQVGMNSAATFQLSLIGSGKNPFTNAAQQFIVQLNCCLAPSLTMTYKLDDFTDLDLGFNAFIDANGNLGNIYLVNPNN